MRPMIWPPLSIGLSFISNMVTFSLPKPLTVPSQLRHEHTSYKRQHLLPKGQKLVKCKKVYNCKYKCKTHVQKL